MSLPRPLRHAGISCVLLVLLAASACHRDAVAIGRNHEIWAIDQGTNIIHVFDTTLTETARIDLGSRGARVPHLIEFTSDGRYAFVANLATGNVAVIRAEDRELVALIPTGPRTHHVAVAPDDRRAIVSVIGAPDTPWDGKLVEITIDTAREQFTVTRELVLARDPHFAVRRARFSATGGPVCMDFTEDGRFGYVALGPTLDEGGALVVDLHEMRLVEAFAPTQVQANCGTVLSRDGSHMYMVGGDRGVGVWQALDTRTHRPSHREMSRGHDAHGLAVSPNGREYWVVNRVTSNAIILDARSNKVIAEIPFAGKTPDIIAFSPDGGRAYITLRGPKPVTMPHLAVGETPGFAVFVTGTRELFRLVEPARGNEASDFHGIAVRPLPAR
jgi:DNA-binding beta-propeller fold protein YncE